MNTGFLSYCLNFGMFHSIWQVYNLLSLYVTCARLFFELNSGDFQSVPPLKNSTFIWICEDADF